MLLVLLVVADMLFKVEDVLLIVLEDVVLLVHHCLPFSCLLRFSFSSRPLEGSGQL